MTVEKHYYDIGFAIDKKVFKKKVWKNFMIPFQKTVHCTEADALDALTEFLEEHGIHIYVYNRSAELQGKLDQFNDFYGLK